MTWSWKSWIYITGKDLEGLKWSDSRIWYEKDGSEENILQDYFQHKSRIKLVLLIKELCRKVKRTPKQAARTLQQKYSFIIIIICRKVADIILAFLLSFDKNRREIKGGGSNEWIKDNNKNNIYKVKGHSAN